MYFDLVKVAEHNRRDPFIKVKTLAVEGTGSYKLYALGHPIDKASLGLPETLSVQNLAQFDEDLTDIGLCKGNEEKKYIEMLKKRKGEIKYSDATTAYLDTTLQARLETDLEDILSGVTVRHKDCTILVCRPKDQCEPCKRYRSTLQKLQSCQSSSKLYFLVSKTVLLG